MKINFRFSAIPLVFICNIKCCILNEFLHSNFLIDLVSNLIPHNLAPLPLKLHYFLSKNMLMVIGMRLKIFSEVNNASAIAMKASGLH